MGTERSTPVDLTLAVIDHERDRDWDWEFVPDQPVRAVPVLYAVLYALVIPVPAPGTFICTWNGTWVWNVFLFCSDRLLPKCCLMLHMCCWMWIFPLIKLHTSFMWINLQNIKTLYSVEIMKILPVYVSTQIIKLFQFEENFNLIISNIIIWKGTFSKSLYYLLLITHMLTLLHYLYCRG